MSLFVPRQRYGVEMLDEPGVDAAVARRSLSDVARANALFGGARAVVAELRDALRECEGGRATVLDVGTGIGDIPRRARATLAGYGVALHITGLEYTETLARAAREAGVPPVVGDARALPFADASIDVVMCSQLLHHFEHERAVEVLREMHRVARRRVIVSDLRRSWIAAAGIWLASFPLRFHPVSRHDGVVSVLRGFRAHELRALAAGASGATPAVRNRLGFRVTASWSPNHPPKPYINAMIATHKEHA
ncbi:MAG: methyltransferase domain-containing protein [Gemmatimonadaceae bacterium]